MSPIAALCRASSVPKIVGDRSLQEQDVADLKDQSFGLCTSCAAWRSMRISRDRVHFEATLRDVVRVIQLEAGPHHRVSSTGTMERRRIELR
jgi:hypothetical protein